MIVACVCFFCVLLLRSSAPPLAFTCWPKGAEQTVASVSQPCAGRHRQLKVAEAAGLLGSDATGAFVYLPKRHRVCLSLLAWKCPCLAFRQRRKAVRRSPDSAQQVPSKLLFNASCACSSQVCSCSAGAVPAVCSVGLCCHPRSIVVSLCFAGSLFGIYSPSRGCDN